MMSLGISMAYLLTSSPQTDQFLWGPFPPVSHMSLGIPFGNLYYKARCFSLLHQKSSMLLLGRVAYNPEVENRIFLAPKSLGTKEEGVFPKK